MVCEAPPDFFGRLLHGAEVNFVRDDMRAATLRVTARSLQLSRVTHRALGAARFDGVRRPQRMSANAMMPVGAEEYDTAVMATS